MNEDLFGPSLALPCEPQTFQTLFHDNLRNVATLQNLCYSSTVNTDAMRSNRFKWDI